MKTLGPRPADPSKISFDRRCFVQDGEIVEWVIVHHAASMRYPDVFADEAAARRAGGEVQRRTRPRMVRVSWT